MQNFKIIIVLIVLSLATKIQAQQTSFSFNGEEINAGNKNSFVEINTDKDTLKIPISIFHGKTQGPVLGITARVHGVEYATIIAD